MAKTTACSMAIFDAGLKNAHRVNAIFNGGSTPKSYHDAQSIEPNTL